MPWEEKVGGKTMQKKPERPLIAAARRYGNQPGT